MSRHAFPLAAVVLAGCLLQSAAVAQPRDVKVHRVSAKQLIEAYAKNERAAGDKYGDRDRPQEVEVQGVVAKEQRGKFGPLVILEGGHGLRVAIALRDDRQQDVKRGETIVVRGRCKGLLERDKTIDIVNGVLVRDRDRDRD